MICTQPGLREPSGSPSKLFNIVELLEQVLVYLDLSDLARFRRVCRLWNEVIQASKSVRQKRFVEPMERSEWILQLAYGTRKVKMVSQLPDSCWYWKAFVPSTLHPALRNVVSYILSISKATPFCYYCEHLVHHNGQHSKYYQLARDANTPNQGKPIVYSLNPEFYRIYPSVWLTLAPRAFSRWVSKHRLHDTLLCQPPCKLLRYTVRCSHGISVEAELQSTIGLTFRDLLDFARAQAGPNERCKINHGLEPGNIAVVEMLDVTPADTAWVDKARTRSERARRQEQRKQPSKEYRRARKEGTVVD